MIFNVVADKEGVNATVLIRSCAPDHCTHIAP
jgi:3-methyladenine DNA glycosylase Mpg